jgi:hypothetical protein
LILTTGVVTGCEENAASGFTQADDMASCGGREDAVLADEELLDAVGSTNLGDQLDNLWVPVPTITTDYEERACRTCQTKL